MEFRKILTLRGPNIWTRLPVLEATVVVGQSAPRTPAEKAALRDRLFSWLPTLAEPDFVEHLGGEPNLAHVLERAALALHTVAGWPVTFGKTTATDEPGVYQVVMQYEEESLGRACLETARRLVNAASNQQPFDVAAEIKAIHELGDGVCLGPSTRAIVNAATVRGLPVRRLNSGSLVQLGQGAVQRRIRTAETDRTGAVAETIASDKELTKTLLRAIGVPVPEGRPVDSPEDAWAAAQEIGPPVVVKPRDGNHGRGVFTGLSGCEQIQAAFRHASEEGEGGVLVERFALGAEHRLLVVGNRVVAATRGEAAKVVGNGRDSVAQLVEDQINSDPRRGTNDDNKPLALVELDRTNLLLVEQQGFRPDSIPPDGKTVIVQHNGNLSIDVTDQVHPEVAARAVEAARVVGLDVAGLDIVVEDIGRPLEKQRGVVVEVNAGPSLQMHLEPSQGRPQPVGEAIVDMLFADGQSGRIPVAYVTGAKATAIAQLLTHLVLGERRHVGLATSDGLFLDERRIRPGDCANAEGAHQLLLNPLVENAVLATSTAGVLNSGLGCEHCDLLVLGGTPVAKDRQPPHVTAVIVEAVLPGGACVLPAEDNSASLAKRCKGEVIYYSSDTEHPLVMRHLAGRGRAVFVQQGAIKLADPDFQQTLVALEKIAHLNLAVVLAAAAGAWALGLSVETIANRLIDAKA